MAIPGILRRIAHWSLCAFVLASLWTRNTDRPNELPELYSSYAARLNVIASVADILDKGTRDRQRSVAYAMLIYDETLEAEIDPTLLAALVMTESYADPRAVSITGARGLGQIVPGIWLGSYPKCGDDLFDPRTNICYAAKILRLYIDKYGDLRYALNRYSGYTEVYGFTYDHSPYTLRIDNFQGSD